ncbi:heparinase II/III-like protein [Streptomyces sp. 840.1]|uniref:heparinase II/III domain-containing protein n=1 Tax=Streptomyces sp. 840.1 TaxID=2485152 RepID=UPI000F9D630F|nr:heparinase II/III family protein [Streptomyces sp. 840.1]ROQ59168.1 heparinase II/III-like protein [Streptomyces sp. 840.1]
MTTGILGASFRSALGPELARLLADPAGRVGVPDVTCREVWDAVPLPVRERLTAEARAELARPEPRLTAGDWARAARDGDRGAYEDRAWELQERVSRLVLAAVLSGEVADATAAGEVCPHLDAAVDGLVRFAEASTWCWAPHDRFTAARGEVVPDADEPYLDLGAAEVAALFAWADHVLGPHLERRAPGLRRRLRREVDRRVLVPFEQVRDWRWIGADGGANNWNPWIHSAVLACALLLCDDDVRRARLVRLVVGGLDHYIAALPDDGGVDEGIAYWWAGACRVLEVLDLLAGVGGPALDARELPLLGELLRYPQRMHLGGSWYVNVGDAPPRLSGDRPWHVPYRWGARLGLPETSAHAVAGARQEGDPAPARAGLGRALTALADARWCSAVTARAAPDDGAPWLAGQVWLPRLEILVARQEAVSTRGLTVAVKAGHNGEHHNHLDVGSYWVAVDGRPLVVDAGRPRYTTQTFGPDRYAAWPFQSAWHNVPEPGDTQSPGREFTAGEVTVCLDGERSGLSAELRGAYPAGPLTSWKRSVDLVRPTGAAAAYIDVQDNWRGRLPYVRLRHLLSGHVELGDGVARVTAEGSGVVMRWDPALCDASAERVELDDPLLSASWGGFLTRLTLTVRDPGSAGGVAVRWEAAG